MPDHSEQLELGPEAPQRMRGLQLTITRRVARHGYVTGRVERGTREYPKGTDLHILLKWLPKQS